MVSDITDENPEITKTSFWLPLPKRSDEFMLALLIVAFVVFGLSWFGLAGDWMDVDEVRHVEVEFRIELNTATWQEFTMIPGIGEKIAKRIVSSRETEGPWRNFRDLARVRGIGPVMLERIRPFVATKSVDTKNSQPDRPYLSNRRSEGTKSGF